MTDKTGGPAFPLVVQNGDCTAYENGMTLRDYFAGQAIVGLFACPKKINSADEISGIEFVKLSYEIADAMLKEREK